MAIKLKSGILGFYLLFAGSLTGPLLAQVLVSGTVKNKSGEPVESAYIKVEPQNLSSAIEAYSNKEGAFVLNLDQGGQYFVSALFPGYYELKRKPVTLVIGTNIIAIDLIAAEGSSYTVDVSPEKDLVVEHIASSDGLTEEKILGIPATRSNYLQNMLAVLPGAIKDQKGQLHFYGSPAEQTNWLLDGFSVADPVTGQFETILGVEAVQSFDLFSGRYSVEFGKGSGGTVTFNSGMGDNSFKTHATNFIPGVENSRGLRLSSWRPRFTFSGPIKKDRIWFYNGLDFNYRQNIIPELPRGQDRTLTWIMSNLFRVQANLTPSNTLTTDFLYNYFNAPKTGLSPLDPVETTLDRRARRYFFNIKDQIYFPSKMILEFGYGSYRSINRSVPLGHTIYQITPFGRRGNFTTDSLELGNRDQWLANAFLPTFNRLGSHQFKVGLDFNYSRYFQDVERTGFEYFRVDGTRAKSVFFAGNGEFTKSNLETAAYLQDRWAIRPWLVTEAGIRWDRDRLLSENAVTPRFSFAMMPPGLKSTKFSAGFGLVPSATYLRLFSRDLDQYAISTRYAKDGKSIVEGPSVSFFTIDKNRLKIPNTTNISFGLEQALPRDLRIRANYLRKRSHNGYTFSPVMNPSLFGDPMRFPGYNLGAIYELQNSKLEKYDSLEISLSKQFLKKYDWFLSYARSRAYSNAALGVNIDDPIIYSDLAGRLPWDTPNRLVSWGLFPLNRNYSLAYFLEWRDGFVFSVYDDEGRQVGKINSWEFPRYFTLNLHLERKLAFLRYNWAVRLGVDNITNRANYALVNNNIASPDFLQFYGSEPRKLVVRIRWLGKINQ
jgi:carboxypeptidase family protein